jgi:GNAT superfamily N-acetyltransferase
MDTTHVSGRKLKETEKTFALHFFERIAMKQLVKFFSFLLFIAYSGSLLANNLKDISVQNYQIRPGHFADAPQLVPLMDQLGYPQSYESIQQKLTTYFSTPGHGVFVAEHHGKIIGLVTFGTYELFAENGKSCHIDVLVVDKDHRKKGIGKRLLQKVETYGRSHGCFITELIVGMWRKNEGIHDFYDTQGYKNEGNFEVKYLRKEL